MGCEESNIDKSKIHDAKCFAITCMDFRLVDDSVKFLDSLGLEMNYDHFVLAGSSLGFTQQKYEYWGKTLLDHMSIGLSLHHFREIVFLDHRDCGAFKKFYPEVNPKNEVELHTRHMQLAHDKLARLFPNFKFKGYLMDLEGKCIELLIKQTPKIDSSRVIEDIFLTSLKH